MEKRTCCICGEELRGFGNNPEPYMPGVNEDGQQLDCCDMCNILYVIPSRINAREEAAE